MPQIDISQKLPSMLVVYQVFFDFHFIERKYNILTPAFFARSSITTICKPIYMTYTVFTWASKVGRTRVSLMRVELGFRSQDDFVSSIYSCSVSDQDGVRKFSACFYRCIRSIVATKKTYGT